MTNRLTDAELAAMQERCDKATAGPWFWKVNLKSKECVLESHGRGGMLEHVMDFVRWGMGGAKPRFLNQEKCLMVDVDKLGCIIPKREHHSDWAQGVSHPDAAFIAHARTDMETLLTAYRELAEENRELSGLIRRFLPMVDFRDSCSSEEYDDLKEQIEMILAAKEQA
jgi:hypothetical protein